LNYLRQQVKAVNVNKVGSAYKLKYFFFIHSKTWVRAETSVKTISQVKVFLIMIVLRSTTFCYPLS